MLCPNFHILPSNLYSLLSLPSPIKTPPPLPPTSLQAFFPPPQARLNPPPNPITTPSATSRNHPSTQQALHLHAHSPSGTSITAPSPPQFHHGRAGVGGMARSYSATSAPAILAHGADIAACTSARAGLRATATRTSSARAATPTCWSSTSPLGWGGGGGATPRCTRRGRRHLASVCSGWLRWSWMAARC